LSEIATKREAREKEINEDLLYEEIKRADYAS
jgi:hypothetical protein